MYLNQSISLSYKLRMNYKHVIGVGSLMVLIGAFFYSIPEPSNDRNWVPTHAVLQTATINSNTITINNIRDFSHENGTLQKNYYSQTVNVQDLESLWLLVEPLSRQAAIAHTFVSFGFKDGQYITVSIEGRRTVGEEYSALKGLFKQYELQYVFASEWDQFTLRTKKHGNDVYMYPIEVETKVQQQLFTALATRANELAQTPEFYHTFTKNCTNTLINHLLTITHYKLPFTIKNYLPGYVDQVAYMAGLITTSNEFSAAKPSFNIRNTAINASKAGFSATIRANRNL